MNEYMEYQGIFLREKTEKLKTFRPKDHFTRKGEDPPIFWKRKMKFITKE